MSLSPVIGSVSNPFSITPLSECAVGVELGACGGASFSTGTMGVANAIYAYPVMIYKQTWIKDAHFVKNTSNAGFTMDMGLFNEAGVKVCSTGVVTADVFWGTGSPINKTVMPGRYMAMLWGSSASMTFASFLITVASQGMTPFDGWINCRGWTGVAGGLPATMPGALTNLSNINFPMFGFYGRQW